MAKKIAVENSKTKPSTLAKTKIKESSFKIKANTFKAFNQSQISPSVQENTTTIEHQIKSLMINWLFYQKVFPRY